MSSLVLSEIRETIDRSQQNIEDLKKFLPGRELTKAPDNLIAVERQSDGETHDVFIEPMGRLSLALRLAVTDVIHRLRTTLDHLAYQLAVRNNFPLTKIGRTPEQEIWFRRLCFPIHDTEARFESRAGEIKKVVGDKPVAEMKRLQPYQGLDIGKRLWRLSELDNITKHRVIVAVDPRFSHAQVAVDVGSEQLSGTVTIADDTERSLKNRTQLFRFRVEPDGSNQPPKVNVNVKPAIEPVLSDTDGLCDGVNIFDVMRESLSTVTVVIDDFERKFF